MCVVKRKGVGDGERIWVLEARPHGQFRSGAFKASIDRQGCVELHTHITYLDVLYLCSNCMSGETCGAVLWYDRRAQTSLRTSTPVAPVDGKGYLGKYKIAPVKTLPPAKQYE